MTINEAKEYISFGIKEGYFNEEEFEIMSDEEMIAFAVYNSERGDYYANEAHKE